MSSIPLMKLCLHFSKSIFLGSRYFGPFEKSFLVCCFDNSKIMTISTRKEFLKGELTKLQTITEGSAKVDQHKLLSAKNLST